MAQHVYEFYPFYEGSLTIAAVNKALADYRTTNNTTIIIDPMDGVGLETLICYYRKLIQAA